MGEKDCGELYEALENLVGDLYLFGLAEITLEDIYAGSCHDASKALKRLQQHRNADKFDLAIGQKRRETDPDLLTGCADDDSELWRALAQIPSEQLDEILESGLGHKENGGPAFTTEHHHELCLGVMAGCYQFVPAIQKQAIREGIESAAELGIPVSTKNLEKGGPLFTGGNA